MSKLEEEAKEFMEKRRLTKVTPVEPKTTPNTDATFEIYFVEILSALIASRAYSHKYEEDTFDEAFGIATRARKYFLAKD